MHNEKSVVTALLVTMHWRWYRVPTNKHRKFSMIFQWYFKTKFPNFHDNSERHKTEKTQDQMLLMASLHTLCPLLGVLRKSVKVFLLDLMNSVSVNIYLSMQLIKTMSIPEFNDFSMSDWSNIQWFFPDFLFSTNFKSFSWILMIFP